MRRSLQVEGGGVVEAVGGGGRLLEQGGGGGWDEVGGGGAGGLGAEGGLGRRRRGGRDNGPGRRSNGPRGSSWGSGSRGSGRLGAGRGVGPEVAKAVLTDALDAEDLVADALTGSPQDLHGVAVVLHVGVEAVKEAVLTELLAGRCAVFLKELVTELVAVLVGLE